MATITVGRSPASRAVTVTTTSGSAAITGAAGTFDSPEDVGRTITGAGIPAGATILSVQSRTAATMSANATASATVPATLGRGATYTYGFEGWAPETDAESEGYTILGGGGATSPSRLTNPTTPAPQFTR